MANTHPTETVSSKAVILYLGLSFSFNISPLLLNLLCLFFSSFGFSISPLPSPAPLSSIFLLLLFSLKVILLFHLPFASNSPSNIPFSCIFMSSPPILLYLSSCSSFSPHPFLHLLLQLPPFSIFCVPAAPLVSSWLWKCSLGWECLQGCRWLPDILSLILTREKAPNEGRREKNGGSVGGYFC